LDTPFKDLLPEIVWTTPADLWSQPCGFGPQIVPGGRPQMLDQIFKTTPISDLHSYKGCLSVELPRPLRDRKMNVRLVIFTHTYTNRENLMKIDPGSSEITGLKREREVTSLLHYKADAAG